MVKPLPVTKYIHWIAICIDKSNICSLTDWLNELEHSEDTEILELHTSQVDAHSILIILKVSSPLEEI